MNVSIGVAQVDELDTVLEILDDSARWLADRGIDQWPASFSRDATWRIERIRSYLEHGLTYLARDENGQAVGTFTLSRAADPQFAHGWPDGTEAGGYIFRMAVRRPVAGRDLGGLMLDWAAEEIARWGRRWLRLDVHRHNERLQRYYEQHGFTKVAEVTAPDLSVPGRIRGSGTLMQRPVPNVEGDVLVNNWDPDGLAADWLEASNLVYDLKLDDLHESQELGWNDAIDRAVHALEISDLKVRHAAVGIVGERRLDEPPTGREAWNSAIDQAARALDALVSLTKQASGMYYRALTGEGPP